MVRMRLNAAFAGAAAMAAADQNPIRGPNKARPSRKTKTSEPVPSSAATARMPPTLSKPAMRISAISQPINGGLLT